MNQTSGQGAPRAHEAKSEGFGALHAQGKDIVDAAGKVVVLKGFGLGGWLMPEGYMLGNPGGKDSPRGIRAAVEAKLGVEKTNAFFATYQQNYVTRADIQALATWGFNSVRLPLNANSLMPRRRNRSKRRTFTTRRASNRSTIW